MNILIKFLKLFKLIFDKSINIKFQSPIKKKLLLVDNNTEKYLIGPLLSNFDYISITTRPNQRGGEFHLNFKILFYLIEGLKKKLNFKNSYVFACIKYIQPKVILENTFDHNLILVAKFFPNIEFIILNQGKWFHLLPRGLKLISSFPVELSLINAKNASNVTHLVWGQMDVDFFKEHVFKKNNIGIKIVKGGSYQGSYYFEKKIENKNQRDLLFISQAHNSFFNSKNKISKIVIKDTISALNLILRYVKENQLKFGYLVRSKKEFDKDEIDLVSSFKKDYDFEIIRHEGINTIWDETQNSKIILSNNSTGAHDAMVNYKKTILMPLSSKDIYVWFSNNKKYKDDKDFWEWTVENSNYDEFKSIADNLINLDIDIYKKTIKDKIDYLSFSQSDNKPSYKYIRELIDKKL